MRRLALRIALLGWYILSCCCYCLSLALQPQQRFQRSRRNHGGDVRHQRRPCCHAVTANSIALKASITFHTDSDISGDAVSGKTSLKVGIVGAGAIAFATAAILSKSGHDVQLWSPSGKGTAGPDSSELGLLTATGAIKEYSFTPRIARTSRQLVQENEVVMICLPANGHKRVFDELAPDLAISSSISSKLQQKHVIISSHASLGALYLTRAIERERMLSRTPQRTTEEDMPTITAWGTTVCTARQPSRTNVDLKSIRKSVDVCTIPEQESSSALTTCQTLFPGITFQPRDGLLAISLSNVNPQNHLGMALGNMSRMDKGESWYQFQMTTPRIGKLLEDLDRERLDIADALGVDVKTIYEHFALSFHVPLMDSVSDMCQEIYKSGNDVYGPNDPFSRYITEDVPFGLSLTVALGRMVNRPAKLHESGIMICNSMYDRDFVAENDLLEALGLDQMSLEELQRALTVRQPLTSAS